MPRRIAFVEAPPGRSRRTWLWHAVLKPLAAARALSVPLGVAAALALLVGALAVARVRVVAEQGRWEVAFGSAAAVSPAGARQAAMPAPVALTREEVAAMVVAAVRQSETRLAGETAARIEAAAAQLDRRHLTALTSLADQMRYFERTQTILYKETDRTRAAFESVAARLPAAREAQP